MLCEALLYVLHSHNADVFTKNGEVFVIIHLSIYSTRNMVPAYELLLIIHWIVSPPPLLHLFSFLFLYFLVEKAACVWTKLSTAMETELRTTKDQWWDCSACFQGVQHFHKILKGKFKWFSAIPYQLDILLCYIENSGLLLCELQFIISGNIT